MRIGPSRYLLFGSAVAVPGIVLAGLSWRSVRLEGEEKRTALRAQAEGITRVVRREIRALAEREAERFWGAAGGTVPEALARARELGIPARAGEGAGRGEPGPEPAVLVQRDDPALVPEFRRAESLEFGGDPSSAAVLYRDLGMRVEAPSTRAMLLHAQARSSATAGDAEGAAVAYETLAESSPYGVGESGVPYGILGLARRFELKPDPAALDRFLDALAGSEAPGHVRVVLLRHLHGLSSPADLRRRIEGGLDSAEDLAGLERFVSWVGGADERLAVCGASVRLHSRRSLEGGRVAVSVALSDFPGGITRGVVEEARGGGLEVSIGATLPPPAGGRERLVEAADDALEGFVLAVDLVDPSRARPSRARAATGAGLVGTLILSLLLGVGLLVRGASQEARLARLRGEFVSGVSHELKTPLTSIRMFAEMLEDGRVSGEGKRREYQGLIRQESLRLSRLVDNVLDFSRIDAGRRTYLLERCDLNGVVERAVATLRAYAGGEGPSVDLRLPEAEADATARGDADALMGAVLNLLDNAVKYGGGTPVEVRLDPGAVMHRILVRDSGPGIPEGERDHVFDPYMRGRAAARGAAGGAGLGLAIVRHTMEGHGGHVTLRTAPGDGCEFTLEVPAWPGSS